MIIKIKFSSGKEIELTQEEYAEITVRGKITLVPYDSTPVVVQFVQPVAPYPYGLTTVTYSAASKA